MYYKAIPANQWGNISYDGKGYSLFKLGEIDGAIQSAGNSITLNPEYANAWYNLAMYSIEKIKQMKLYLTLEMPGLIISRY